MKTKAYIIIIIGLFFLGRNLGWFDHILEDLTNKLSLDLGEYWPFIIILLGVYLLFVSKK